MTPVRIVRNLKDLDAELKLLDSAAQLSDYELRKGFTEFKMEIHPTLVDDPDSEEYRAEQFALYKKLSGKDYATENEVTKFDVIEAIATPFPYSSKSPTIVGNHLIALGHVIKTLNLKVGSKVLEFGPGWGNTTIMMARMGLHVTAVDIEPNFVQLIKERAKRIGLDGIEATLGDFSIVDELNEKYDAVLFFECFHHCSNHQELIKSLDRVLKPGGKIFFAAEPILEEFPIPWGLRLDGESLWAIRKNGWLELGFKESYFRTLCYKNGWVLEKVVNSETPWGTIFVATRVPQEQKKVEVKISGLDNRIKTQVGKIDSEGFIRSCGVPGYLIYGPYLTLGPGRYNIRIWGDIKNKPLVFKKSIGLFDIVAEGGNTSICSQDLNVNIANGDNENLLIDIDFDLDRFFVDLEFRVFINQGANGYVKKIEITER